MIVETVKIVAPVSIENPHGYVVINKGDLADHHEIFGAKKKDAAVVQKPMLPHVSEPVKK